MKKLLISVALLLTTTLLFVACGEDEQINNPLTSNLVGKFVASDEQSSEGVLVEGTDATGTVFFSTHTDAEGNFEITKLPADMNGAIITFSSDSKVLQQISLKTFVKLSESNAAKGKKTTDVLQGGEYDNLTNLRFIVTDKTTDASIEGALVRLFTSNNAYFTQTTDNEGVAQFDSIVAGRYRIVITKQDYKGVEEGLNVPSPASDNIVTLNYPYQLVPNGNNGGGNDKDSCYNNAAYILVIDAQTKAPVVGAIVTLTNGTHATDTTDGNGIAYFENIVSGEYLVKAKVPDSTNKTGYREIDAIARFHVYCEDTVEVTLPVYMQNTKDCCDGKATIIVKDTADFAPIQGVIVKLWRGGAIVDEKLTDAKGKVVFEQLCEGNYGVSMYTSNGEVKEFTFGLDCNNKVIFEKYFGVANNTPCDNGLLIVSVIAQSGDKIDTTNISYVEGANVYVILPDGSVRNGITSANGMVTFSGLPDGKMTVKVIKDGYAKSVETIRMPCNTTFSFTSWIHPNNSNQ